MEKKSEFWTVSGVDWFGLNIRAASEREGASEGGSRWSDQSGSSTITVVFAQKPTGAIEVSYSAIQSESHISNIYGQFITDVSIWSSSSPREKPSEQTSLV